MQCDCLTVIIKRIAIGSVWYIKGDQRAATEFTWSQVYVIKP